MQSAWQWMSLPRLSPGDSVAVLSPSFAAPAVGEAVHEQAMVRIREDLQLVPVEFRTTRQLHASPQERAADVNAAFADPSIKAVMATIGGDDQITVLPHLNSEVIRHNPKPFFGYSDNTHLLNWLWRHGIPGFYGGSTQVHLGAGPRIDDVHLRSLQATLFHGGILEITDPGESEDYGLDWADPRALTEFGYRTPTDPWLWAGPAWAVEGRTWGGCLEVIDQLGVAGQLPSPHEVEHGILLLETSEELPSADRVRRCVRALGERGLLGVLNGVLIARPPASSPKHRRSPAEQEKYRKDQADVVVEQVNRYNPSAVVCAGVPFGHTRPQWVLPYGGLMRLDGVKRRITATYSGDRG
ncbi:S66 family peptidase [Kocuria sp.]|uniref:S66 family peptidase n=1 Tax=Kocuria sp. TaxID=1871328 RepID=UPI0026DFCFEB|nr:S66 peptidase family protein [Kocuria sp.]MDO5618999.1 LD-carboxypeptidase [Kocuria sp.]